MTHPSDPTSCGTFSCLKNQFLLTTYESCRDNQVSKQTIKYRMLGMILKEIELTFGQVSQLVHTHTPVHPQVAEILRPLVKQEHYQILLAQDFVENEKLVKIMKHVCKNDHTDVVHAMLAMDGMSGNKLNHGANVDVKRYVENLKFGLTGGLGLYDQEKCDDLKRAHVFAVRQVYQKLPVQAQRVNNVFHVLKRVLQEYTGEEWTIGGTTVVHNLDEDTLKECVETYKDNMSESHYLKMMELLKTKTGQQRTAAAAVSDEEEEEEEEEVVVVVPSKKRKVK